MNNSKQLAINGGKPIRSKSWPGYSKGDSLVDKKHLRAVYQVLETKQFFRYGDTPYEQTYAGKFEIALQQFFDVKHALAINSGTTAITTGLLAAGVTPGSLVACPSFTFAATPSAIIQANCKPLLIEVTKDLHLDLEDLKRKYTPELKAIVPVHMRGMACDIPAIIQFAEEHNLIVVEDAAAACGVSLHGKKLGTYGHAGAFSTQADKFINTGEGGFLITNDDDIFKKALRYSGDYLNDNSPLNYPLYSFRMDEIRAALAYSQVADLERNLIKQRRVYDSVIEKLQHYPQLQLRQPISEDSVLGNKLVFRIPGISGAKASWFAQALTAEGIDAWAFGDPNNMNQRAFWNWRFLPNATKDLLPHSYKFISESIDISLFAKLTKQDINDLINAIDKILNIGEKNAYRN